MPEIVTFTSTTPVSTGVPPPPTVKQRSSRRLRQFGLALLSLLWFALADALSTRAARGLTNRFDLDAARPLLSALFLVFLLTVGFAVFEALTGNGFGMRRAAGLPRRATAGHEWVLGIAIGWGLAIGSVLPMAFGRSFHVRLWTGQQAWMLLAMNFLTLLIAALATEMGLRGYPFRRLVGAFGQGWATALLAIALGSLQWFTPESTVTSVLVTLLFSVLFSLAWLRTHGLWLGWGLRAAWSISIAVLFGLPLHGLGSYASVVQTRAIRPAWLTGNAFGPEGAVLTVFALLAAIIILLRLTSDYAWQYTRPEIISAGYEVNPPPPAAHIAMAQEAEVRPASLVHILPSTPQTQTLDHS